MTRSAISADEVFTARGVIGEAVVVENGRVVEVTTRQQLGDIDVVHHPGATILPTFVDSHFHPLGYAALLSGISLKEAAGIPELVETVADAASNRGSGAITAHRFDDTTLGRMPSRLDLDLACTDRPVLISRYCGHVAVANSAALQLAGVGSTTADPAGGSIDRDDDGSPTGVLRETAIALVADAMGHLVPPPDDRAVLAALQGLLPLGITRMTAIVAAGDPVGCRVGAELDTLCRLARDLPMDIDVLVIADAPADLRAAADQVGAAGGRLRFWGWKDFADGSFGGHTAAMWEPFADRDTTGTLRLRPDHAVEMTRTVLDLGGVAALHAIGDRAIDGVLDVYDRVLADGADPNSLRIEHVSVPTAGAITRLATTGVVASIQPSFVSSEGGWVRARLGPSRRPYPFATMEAAGVRMVAGSDCPVERPDPLAGVISAVTRPGWSDDQHVTPESAVGFFSDNAFEHLGLQQPLSSGAPAGLVVVRGEPASPHSVIEEVYVGGLATAHAKGTWPG
ncbi:amidohydrolase [soil metagenome]